MPWPLSTEDKEELRRLGARIREIRQSKQLSQEAVGRAIGKDRQSIHKLEKGEFNPSYIYLMKLASGLGVSISELLAEDTSGNR